ncbi:MAG: hypothetical protein ACHREM_05375 [Polyangiales bacterium]
MTTREVQAEQMTYYEAVGCGQDAQYSCRATSAGQYSIGAACEPRERWGLRASDGKIYDAWGTLRGDGTDRPELADARRQALTASAAHDIPCDPASVSMIDGVTAEGCGQRVSYRMVDEVMPTAPGHLQITEGHRFVLIGRVDIGKAP